MFLLLAVTFLSVYSGLLCLRLYLCIYLRRSSKLGFIKNVNHIQICHVEYRHHPHLPIPKKQRGKWQEKGKHGIKIIVEIKRLKSPGNVPTKCRKLGEKNASLRAPQSLPPSDESREAAAPDLEEFPAICTTKNVVGNLLTSTEKQQNSVHQAIYLPIFSESAVQDACCFFGCHHDQRGCRIADYMVLLRGAVNKTILWEIHSRTHFPIFPAKTYMETKLCVPISQAGLLFTT